MDASQGDWRDPEWTFWSVPGGGSLGATLGSTLWDFEIESLRASLGSALGGGSLDGFSLVSSTALGATGVVAKGGCLFSGGIRWFGPGSGV